VAFTWSLACTGKFVWPIPDKGLKKRLHRIAAPTLVVWGEHDSLVPTVYAQEFASRIPDARVELVSEAAQRAAPSSSWSEWSAVVRESSPV
jgi:pimeloyl-ACP methyl ester carboxylesterase